jgi:hypothetical protein
MSKITQDEFDAIQKIVQKMTLRRLGDLMLS